MTIALRRFVLAIGIVAPAVYLFVMMQLGALRFPYWDHINQARFILDFFDGKLSFWDLFEE